VLFPTVDDPITKYQGSRNEKELIAMLSSPIISYRCIAIVALLQLGKLDAVKPHIKNASKAMRYIYASAVWFVGKKAIPVLKELAESGDKEIKTRVIQSLEFIAMDEAAPILVELTKDSNHEISELAKYVLLNQYSKE
jgi:HEAT repeat protein